MIRALGLLSLTLLAACVSSTHAAPGSPRVACAQEQADEQAPEDPYADANDAARLATDPIHKLLVGRDPVEGDSLASQPTLSRFENGVRRADILSAQ